MVGGTVPPVSVSQQREPGGFPDLWVCRAPKDLQAFQAPKGLQDRRATEETRVRWDGRDSKETWALWASPVFRDWRVFRDSLVLLEVRVFQARTDVTGPEESQDEVGCLGNKDQMEKRASPDSRGFPDLRPSSTSRSLERRETLEPAESRVCRVNRVSLVQQEVQVPQDQMGPTASLVSLVFEVLQEKKVAHCLDRKVTRVTRGSRVLQVLLRSWTLQATST